MNFNNLFNFEIKNVRKINEGFSVDEKFVINETHLVRLISDDRIDRFKFVFEAQKKFQKIAKCQKVFDFKICSPNSFYITEYLPGKNGLEVIKDYSVKSQYNFGVEAGFELAKFHNKNEVDSFNIKEYLTHYLTTKITEARTKNIDKYLPELEDIISVVEKNIHLFYDLPGLLCHSDYHLFNMIFNNDSYEGVIDFERARYSYFLTDFRNNSPHNVPASKYFASGYIDGYLKGRPTKDFFKLYNLNDLVISIGAIGWILEFDIVTLDESILYIKKLFKSIKNLNNIPDWYVGEIN